MRCPTIAAALCLIVLGAGVVHADSSTPKGAATEFMECLSKGDVEGAKKHAVMGTEDTHQTLSLMGRLFSAQQKFQDAVTKAYPNDAAANVKANTLEQMKSQIEGAKLTETGDTATLTTPQSPQPMKLKKEGAEWKVDVASMPEMTQMKAMAPQLTAMSSAMEATAVDIDAGKFKTFAEAGQALQQKMMAAMQAGGAPQMPATQPGN